MSTTFTLSALALALLLALQHYWRQARQARRVEYIRSYAFPKGLMARLQARRPGLPARDGHLVSRGLRQFFLAYLNGGRQYVAMPSQVVDDLWHEFILYTRHYDEFCRQAFGGFLHHTPAVVLGANRRNNAGLRRVWWHSCKEENINPRQPSRLPLLFALDAKLGIADGFVYSPDCRALHERDGKGGAHCGGDFGNDSVDGSTDGFGDVGSHGAGDGTSHGDAGDGGSSDGGCGGGCGGGD